VLYVISDVAYFFVYRVIRYRRKLVRENIQTSFPDKEEKEILTIEKGFYHHFCDTFFETVKMLNFSEARMKRHFILKNHELVEYFLSNEKDVILMAGHYGNWEWGASAGLWIKPEQNRVFGYIYRPLKNRAFDELFIRIREKFRSKGFPKNNIFREIIKLDREKKKFMISFLSDQKPSTGIATMNVNFLNRDTEVMTGTAKIARHTGAVVCYVEITKIKRSFYEGKVKLITDNPAELTEEEITERYMKLLEKNIMKHPSYYLWSHDRKQINI
jgi:KDO2-lipid IV(A) lauroyltransferase